MTHIIYHNHCPDGFACAYLAWLNYDFGVNCQFWPLTYGDAIPAEIEDGDAVRILDLSFPRPVIEALHARCPDFLLLDHHATAVAALGTLFYCRFAADKCGAAMVWEHWFEGPLPLWLRHIQHRDLSMAFSTDPAIRDALPHHAAIHAGLWRGTERTFLAWHRQLEALELQANDFAYYLRSLGEAILISDGIMLAQILENAKWLTCRGFKVPAVMSPVLQSELGAALCARYPVAPFSMVYAPLADGGARYSLRSTPEGLDVSVIAKGFGGGGHRNAAGFTVEAMI